MPMGALLGLGAFVTFSLALGVRLGVLAWQRRAIPELALAVAFIFSGGIGAALQAVRPLELGSEDFRDAAFAGVRIGMDVGVACQALFTWRVFRAQERWAAWLFVALVAALLGVLAAYAALGVLADERYRGAWFWVEVPIHATCLGWGALEALRYHARLRRRLALGLADPVVVNRMLLWGVALTAAVAAITVPPVHFLLLGPARGAGLIVGLSASFALVSAVCYALTFFPPPAYLRFVARSPRGS